ncbi:hypothetical protein GCM10028807_17680 [Spirosoma daeguense]
MKHPQNTHIMSFNKIPGIASALAASLNKPSGLAAKSLQPTPVTPANKNKVILNTHLQELALLILAELPIKGIISEAANKSRGRILADLRNNDERQLYLASRDVILEFGRQLAKCESPEMLAKVLQIIQGITEGSVVEYNEVKDQI